MKKTVAFNKENIQDFLTLLRERVQQYFKKNRISSKATPFMVFKSIFTLSLVTVNFLALFQAIGITTYLILNATLGFSIAVCAFNTIHDALHGGYVSNRTGNRLIGFIMDLFGASSYYWKKGHTVAHHTFTNIDQHDCDLDTPIVLRVCPNAPLRSYHRFQYIYAPFLYSLNFFHWIYISDTLRIFRFLKSKKSDPNQTPTAEKIAMISFKLVHFFLFIALPMIVTSFPWWIGLIGYALFLMASGLTLTLIFQLAHIVEGVDFPLPDSEGKIERSFAHHQLATTCNFANKNPLITFLFGGLNFQIEHHLFPNICHVHLPKIAAIVREAALEYGLPYHYNSTVLAALKSHFKTLKKLGTPGAFPENALSPSSQS